MTITKQEFIIVSLLKQSGQVWVFNAWRVFNPHDVIVLFFPFLLNDTFYTHIVGVTKISD
jgi:hypothetical protein